MKDTAVMLRKLFAPSQNCITSVKIDNRGFSKRCEKSHIGSGKPDNADCQCASCSISAGQAICPDTTFWYNIWGTLIFSVSVGAMSTNAFVLPLLR